MNDKVSERKLSYQWLEYSRVQAFLLLSSVQFSRSVVSDSLWPHESQQIQEGYLGSLRILQGHGHSMQFSLCWHIFRWITNFHGQWTVGKQWHQHVSPWSQMYPAWVKELRRLGRKVLLIAKIPMGSWVSKKGSSRSGLLANGGGERTEANGRVGRTVTAVDMSLHFPTTFLLFPLLLPWKAGLWARGGS